jgi:hypothetical protein
MEGSRKRLKFIGFDYLNLKTLIGNRDVVGIIYDMLDSVDWLMVRIACVDSVRTMPMDTNRICNYFALKGHLNLLVWAKQQRWSITKEACTNAINSGHLNILQWMLVNGCPFNERLCQIAAVNGYLDIVNWGREVGCRWDKKVCLMACRYGHLDVLIYARRNGCDWNKQECLNIATTHGHHHIVKWIRDRTFIIIPWRRV